MELMLREDQQTAVTVSVDDEHLGAIDRVVELCRKAGLSVDSVLGQLGIITGHTDEAGARRLAGVEGISHVEEEREYQIPPPNAGVQ